MIFDVDTYADRLNQVIKLFFLKNGHCNDIKSIFALIFN